MEDGDHEGHPTLRIDQIVEKMDLSSSSKPNIYLINAGTNDAQQNFQFEDAIHRLTGMIEKAWRLSERATVIVSTLLPSYNEASSPGAHVRALDLNRLIRNRVHTMRGEGRRIVLADMDDGK